MDSFSVLFARSARKELESLPDRIVERVLAKIENLAEVSKPIGSRKLSGEQNLWRLRVGDYRVIYSIDDHQRVIDIVAVRHRKDAYR